MKRILLLVLLLPFFGFGQVDLVKWDNLDSSPRILNTSAVGSTSISGNTNYQYNNDGFMQFTWPSGGYINANNFIELTISAKAGYKVDLTTLQFAYNPAEGTSGCRKYQIRYFKNAAYAATPQNAYLLIDEKNASTTEKTNVNLTFPTATYLLPGEVMYIRIFAYDKANVYNNYIKWGLVNAKSYQSGTYNLPTIKGTVTAYPNNILKAYDDTGTVLKNNYTTLKVLDNDSPSDTPFSSGSVTISTSNIQNGTTSINSDKTVTFTPTPNFTGIGKFDYTISDGTTTSTATATINVTNSTTTDDVLVKWLGADATPSLNANYSGKLTAYNISKGSAITSLNFSSENGIAASPWPKTFRDENAYMEFSIKAETKKVKLSTFNYTTYNVDPNQLKRYQIRYSKDNFVTSELLIDEEIASGNINKSINFSGVTLVPGETLKIRVFAYRLLSSWSDYPFTLMAINKLVSGTNNTVPTLTGTLLDYNANVINANDDNVVTEINRPVSIKIVDNDTAGTGQTITSVEIDGNPDNGSIVSLNTGDDGKVKSITYLPNNDFIGNDTFTYKITNSAGITAIGTVAVTVNALVPSLVVWDGKSNLTKAIVSDNKIVASNLISNGINLQGNYSNKFLFNGAPLTTILDASKYIEFKVNPITNYKLIVGQFNLKFETTTDSGAKKYQVKYCIGSSFTEANSVVYTPETNTVLGDGELNSISIDFPTGTNIVSGQFLYIRIYPYNAPNNNNPNFNIFHSTGGGTGPTLVGVVIDNNTLTAYPDTAESDEGASVIIPVLDNDIIGSDPLSGSPLVRTTVPTNSGGTVSVNNDNTLTFTPTAGFNGITTFNYTIRNSTTISTATVTVNVIFTPPPPPTEAKWDGTKWLNEKYPDINTVVVIAGNFDIASNGNNISRTLDGFEAKILTIEPGATLTLYKGNVITVNSDIVNNGKLIIKDGGSLVQKENSATYSGTEISFEIDRTTTPMYRYDFTYWSSPIKSSPNFTLNTLSPMTLRDKYFSYDPTIGWITDLDGTLQMTPGHGYIVRAPQTYSVNVTEKTNYTAKFIGIPNNGIINVPISSTTSYLIGNPYPSAINALAFYTQNQSIFNGTFYFWSHASKTKATNGKYAYAESDYITYNITGSVGEGEEVISPETECYGCTKRHDGFIASGQGFFIETIGTGFLVFNNDMREIAANKNSTFAKPTKSSKETTVEKNRVWLNLKNDYGAYNEMLLGYITGATNELENGYDAESYASKTAIYSTLGNSNLIIQGRALPFNDSEIIPLGIFTSDISPKDNHNQYSIGINEVDGLFTEKDVFLTDKLLGTTTNLVKGRYTFTATTTAPVNDRFELSFKAGKTLGIDDDLIRLEKGIVIFKKDAQLFVSSSKENIKTVFIYDLNGKLLSQKDWIDNLEYSISDLKKRNQVVIVKVLTYDNTEVTKKVFL